MEFDETRHPDNIRNRARGKQPQEFTQLLAYARGWADATGQTIYIRVNNDPTNTLAADTSLPDDERTYALLRTIRPNSEKQFP